MDLQSTKTPAEREQEEADRLVRPAPKYKPPRRDLRRERDDSDKEVDPDEAADRKDRSENYKDVGGSVGFEPLAGSVVARYAVSSYPKSRMMSDKAAVYNGVAPYRETPGYVPWTQPAQRDFGEGDYDVILKAAKDWLTTPVLAVPLVDANRDIQLRAALDLAIYSGPYNGAIQPTIYNQLLARLAGVSGDGTLLTQRQATDKVAIMKASNEIRKMAAKYAAQDASLAYDLMDLASKVAEDEGQDQDQGQQKQAQDDQTQQDQGQKQAADKYAGLRSAVIKAASENPAARAAFIPVLQAIKGLDV